MHRQGDDEKDGDHRAKLICENLKSLNVLEISRLSCLFWDNSNIGTEGAVTIAQNLNRLTRLDISTESGMVGFNSIGDEGVIMLIRNLPNLVNLSIRS